MYTRYDARRRGVISHHLRLVRPNVERFLMLRAKEEIEGLSSQFQPVIQSVQKTVLLLVITILLRVYCTPSTW